MTSDNPIGSSIVSPEVGSAVVVEAPGELDAVTRGACYRAMTKDDGASRVMLDLARTTFMDCGGYRAIVAARNDLRGTGSELVLTGSTGQPAFLLGLIDRLQPIAAA